MDPIETKILSRYSEKESGSFYDLVQKVKPNYQEYKLKERSEPRFMEVTAEGVVRRRGKSLRLRHQNFDSISPI